MYVELAKMSFRRRYSLGDPMDFPKKYFLQLSQLCPQYHADVFYYLSLIFYMRKMIVRPKITLLNS